ncbi:uncharacterized protein I303_106266 [Kwoniella dejecticola CBS 10117]|uniref:F-box domain-containing protein n=1 Tax=Kwoniella dejecticola CBS 10117 TaxID=1296121 RepID=A0A1A6A1R3_9TREE|nr:uncharacterized protein I303_06285 [Kwoniella dejecticola CBS 10117]OBR83998.1 hypothetical protein I303_06285 [Kwoniella dejecticola CBS 10117]
MDEVDEFVLERILSILSPNDIIACAAVNHRFNRIISTSTPIQLKLHHHIYGTDSSRLRGGRQKGFIEKERLSRLISKEKAFRDFQPTFSSFNIDRGQDVVAAQGRYAVTRTAPRQAFNAAQHGGYTAYCLWTQENDGWKKKEIKVRFLPDLNDSLVDIEKDILIIKEQLQGVIYLVKLHVYHLFDSDDQGYPSPYPVDTITLKLSQNGTTSFRTHARPVFALGPKSILQMSYKGEVSLFDYMTGYSIGNLRLLDKHYVSDCVFIGPDLMGVQVTLSWMEYGGPARGRKSRYILIYRINDLLLSTSSTHTQPFFALKYTSTHSEIPGRLQSQIQAKTNGTNGTIDLGNGGLIDSTNSNGLIQLAFQCYDRSSTSSVSQAYSARFGRPPPQVQIGQREGNHKISNLVLRIPVAEIETHCRRIEGSKEAYKNEYQDDPEFAQLFPDAPSIEYEDWKEMCFVALESEFPDKQDRSSSGLRVFAYNHRETGIVSNYSLNGQDDPLLAEIARTPVQVILYDLNSRAVRLQDRLGYALGGLGEKMDLVFSVRTSQTDEDPIDHSKLEKQVIPLSDDGKGVSQLDVSYRSAGSVINSVHFDATKLFVEYENAVVDMFDFSG